VEGDALNRTRQRSHEAVCRCPEWVESSGSGCQPHVLLPQDPSPAAPALLGSLCYRPSVPFPSDWVSTIGLW
jgi:hypothetical protein